MELEQLIDEFISGRTGKYGGVIDIKGIATQIQSERQQDQQGKPMMVNNLVIAKTNVVMACTYVVDIVGDKPNDVAGDFETLVAYMHFGVDKVAKSIPITDEVV